MRVYFRGACWVDVGVGGGNVGVSDAPGGNSIVAVTVEVGVAVCVGGTDVTVNVAVV